MWMSFLTPWLSMVFPTMIVILSMTLDHLMDHTPGQSIDVDTYRARERKRVQLLQVRLETERDLLALETQLSALRRAREQISGHVRREWVWMRWLRPVVAVAVPLTDEGQAATQATLPAREPHDECQSSPSRNPDGRRVRPPLGDRRADPPEMGQETATRPPIPSSEAPGAGAPSETWDTDGPMHTSEAQDACALSETWDTRTSLRTHAPQPQPEQGAHRDQEPPAQEEPREGAGSTRRPGETAERVLHALERLGTGASDAQIAREVGFSRKTVARWRTRFQQQGRLPVGQPLSDPVGHA